MLGHRLPSQPAHAESAQRPHPDAHHVLDGGDEGHAQQGDEEEQVERSGGRPGQEEGALAQAQVGEKDARQEQQRQDDQQRRQEAIERAHEAASTGAMKR